MKIEDIWPITKSVVLVLAVLGILFMGSSAIDGFLDFFTKRDQIYNEQMVQLAENIISQRVEMNEKLLKEKIKQLDEAILDLAKERQQYITDVGKIVAELQHHFDEKISKLYVDKDDPNKTFDEVVITQEDAEGNPFPVAWALYHPFLDSEERWTVGAYPLKLHTQVVLGESKDRTDSYVKTWLTHDTIAEYRDQEFSIDVTEVEWVKAPPKEKSWMFNPRLSLGIGAGTDVYPYLGFSFFSYGRTKVDMDWKFVGLGIGGNSHDIFFQFLPVEYNLGINVPLIENMFVGPYINVNLDITSGETPYGFGGSLAIPF